MENRYFLNEKYKSILNEKGKSSTCGKQRKNKYSEGYEKNRENFKSGLQNYSTIIQIGAMGPYNCKLVQLTYPN